MKKIFTLFALGMLVFSRLSAQCDPDTQAPVVTTISGLTATILPIKAVTLYATDFLQSAQDNCTPSNNLQLAMRVTGSGGTGFPVDGNGNPVTHFVFTCDWVGQQIVEIWARDASGNAGMNTAALTIADYADFCGIDPVIFSSCVVTEQNEYVEEISWALATVGTPPWTPPFPSSIFAPCVDNIPVLQTGISVKPKKTSDPLNGVSTFDLVLINKHILAQDTLDTPYRILAADANNSRSITTFDIVELRKLILGIYTKLPNSDSWRFLPKSYVFPNPLNPFQTLIPGADTVHTGNYAANHDFIGIKVGDVNGNASVFLQGDAEDRASTDIWTNDLLLNVSDNPVRVPIYLEEAKALLGLQFALRFDPAVLQISDVTFSPGLNNEVEALYYAQPEPGLLTFSWDDVRAPEINAGEPLIWLTIHALQPATLSQAVKFDQLRLRPELYEASGAIRNLELKFKHAPLTAETVIFPAIPNPSTEQVSIPLQLGAPATVSLRVYDLSGRQVYFSENVLPAGFQHLTIPAAGLAGLTGVLSYQVQAGTVTVQGKIVRQ